MLDDKVLDYDGRIAFDCCVHRLLDHVDVDGIYSFMIPSRLSCTTTSGSGISLSIVPCQIFNAMHQNIISIILAKLQRATATSAPTIGSITNVDPASIQRM